MCEYHNTTHDRTKSFIRTVPLFTAEDSLVLLKDSVAPTCLPEEVAKERPTTNPKN